MTKTVSHNNYGIQVAAIQKPTGRWYPSYELKNQVDNFIVSEKITSPDFLTEQEAIDHCLIQLIQQIDDKQTLDK